MFEPVAVAEESPRRSLGRGASALRSWCPRDATGMLGRLIDGQLGATHKTRRPPKRVRGGECLLYARPVVAAVGVRPGLIAGVRSGDLLQHLHKRPETAEQLAHHRVRVRGIGQVPGGGVAVSFGLGVRR